MGEALEGGEEGGNRRRINVVIEISNNEDSIVFNGYTDSR
jgi:hypothetical protein